MVALFPGKIPTGMEYDFLIKESFLFCNCILHTIIVTNVIKNISSIIISIYNFLCFFCIIFYLCYIDSEILMSLGT